MNKALSIRIPDKLSVKLAEVAHETERSKSFHVQKALELYLEEQADLQIALDRFNDTSDDIISLDAMRKKLEI